MIWGMQLKLTFDILGAKRSQLFVREVQIFHFICIYSNLHDPPTFITRTFCVIWLGLYSMFNLYHKKSHWLWRKNGFLIVKYEYNRLFKWYSFEESPYLAQTSFAKYFTLPNAGINYFGQWIFSFGLFIVRIANSRHCMIHL